MTAKEKLKKARAYNYAASKAFGAWLLMIDIICDINDPTILDEETKKDIAAAQEILDRLYNKNKRVSEELYHSLTGLGHVSEETRQRAWLARRKK